MAELDLRLLISPEQIQARVRELGSQISAELGEGVVLLGVLKGACIFLSDLARALTVAAQIDFVRLTSYGSGSVSSGSIEMTKPPELDLKGRKVVVVEDIVDTGLTLRWLVEHLQTYQPAQVKVCAFVDKAERREMDVQLDYVGFHIPKGFLVGYGLDYNEGYRCLPGIYEAKLDH